MALGGFVLVLVSGIFYVYSSTEYSSPVNSYSYLGIVGFWIGYALFSAGSFIGVRLTKQRAAAIRKEQLEIFQEAITPPSLEGLDLSEAILMLNWTADFKTSMRLNARYLGSSPMTWISFSILGIVFAVIAAFCFGRTNYPAILVWFAGGVTLSMVFRYNTVRKFLDLYFPDKSAARNTALIVDKEGLREVVGRTVKIYPWSAVSTAKEIRGLALIGRGGEARMVPDYAFQSREDAKAFVSTIIALKDGKPAPPYDWSAYQQTPAVAEGVWPPPIC